MKKLLLSLLLSIPFILGCSTNTFANYYSQDIISAEDAYILSHVINGEAGADYCSDTLMYYVGSVVLNRVNHPDFPNTIKEVVFQKGQYQCTWDGNYDLEPCDRAKIIAWHLLLEGSKLPCNVVWQSENRRGNIYCKEQNMYFGIKK